MMGHIHIAAGTRSLTVGKIRNSGGLKTLVAGFKRTADGLKQIYAAIEINLSSTNIIGRANSAALVPVTSAPVTANVIGAVGTVVHAWTRTAPDAQPWTIDEPTSGTTTFTTACDQNEGFTATFIDTVTDQAGQVLASATVTVNCANIYYAGGYIGGHPPTLGSSYP